MERFEFNGDWEFELNLPEIQRSNSRWIEYQNIKNANDTLRVRIIDYRSYDPDPLNEQLKTINYIVENESIVIESICKALKEINADYGERCGEYDWFPAELDKQNLGEVLLIQELAILLEHKDNHAYYQFSCAYKGDPEHGLVIVMHSGRLIEYSGIGDLDYRGLYDDLGERAKKFREKNIKNLEFGANQIHKALSKYGKFKPWQKQAMADYFSTLLRTRSNEQLKEVLKNQEFDVNNRIDSKGRNLVDLAAYYDNAEMIDYLIRIGGDFSASMLECTDYYIKKDAIKCLVKHGASVDILNAWGVTPLHNSILSYVSALEKVERNKGKDKKRYDLAKEEIRQLGERIKFYLSMGANPNSLNREGDGIRTILRKRWNENYLSKNRFEEKIEELIIPKKEKKSGWKFWRRNKS